MFKALLPLAVIAAAVAGYMYMAATKPPVKLNPVAERSFFVQTVSAKIETLSPKLVLYGNIVSGREVELRPLVSGRVIEVGETFADGGIVKKGDLLVAIDPFEYRLTVRERTAQLEENRARLEELQSDLKSEEALVAQDEMQVALRTREVERREQLVERGAGTQKLLDESRMALSTEQQRSAERQKLIVALKTRIEQQKSAVVRAELALDRAERDLRDTRLVAPFDGFLHDISTEIGKKVSINDKIARLSDSSRFEAEFQVSDAQYGRLASGGSIVGRPAMVIWRTSDKDFTFPARIARVSGSVSQASGGVNLFARLDSTGSDTLLRPGVFVEVSISDTPYENVIRLPDEAVQNGRQVYVVTGDRLEARQVTIAGRVGNNVLVRGDIGTGDEVVARIFPEIGPGVKVSVP